MVIEILPIPLKAVVALSAYLLAVNDFTATTPTLIPNAAIAAVAAPADTPPVANVTAMPAAPADAANEANNGISNPMAVAKA